MAPELKRMPGFKAVGIEMRTSNATEMNAASAKIPGLWGRFYQEIIPAHIKHAKADARVVGIYSKYASDHSSPYSLLAGVEVSTLDTIPGGMTGIAIPAGKYLVFSAPRIHAPGSDSDLGCDLGIFFRRPKISACLYF